VRRLGIPLEALLRPHVLTWLGALLSFAVWILPWSDAIHRGYAEKEEVTLGGLAVLAGWYGLISLVAYLAYRIGTRVGPLRWLDGDDDSIVRYVLIGLAGVGVAYSYGRVGVDDPSLLVDAIRDQRFNEIRDAIPFEAGIQTLRYAAILAGGIAAARIVLRRRVSAADALSILLLLLAGAIASRLSIVLALLVALVTFARARPGIRVTPLGALGVFVLFFLVTTPLSYLRTANFYRTQFGTGNPLYINAQEFISYLSAPMQASVAVANRAGSGDGPPESYHETNLVDGSFDLDSAEAWIVDTVKPGETLRASAGDAPFDLPAGRRPGPTGRIYVIRATGGPRARVILTNTARLRAPDLRDAVVGLRARYVGRRAVVLYVGVAMEAPDARALRILFPEKPVSGREPVGAAGVTLDRKWRKLGGMLGSLPGPPYAAGHLHIAVDVPRGARGRIELDDVSVGSFGELDSAEALVTYLAPTYSGLGDSEGTQLMSRSYRSYVDVERGLTTNSVFASMFSAMGWIAFLVIAVVAAVAGLVCGHATRYRGYLFLSSIVIAYCFAELWRAYLFNTGIIHFLVLALVGASAAAVLFRQVRKRSSPSP
jgi:hypothetical protein